MHTVEIMLVLIMLSAIIVNLIPNKFRKTIIATSTISIVLDAIVLMLLVF